ncbi:MAG: hypothetical protein AAB036_12505 [Elusimicrobiota bacterium]
MNHSTASCLALSALLASIAAPISASTYYISPAGSNANSGTSASSPWLTFAHAFANMAGSPAGCGHTLVLRNGVYGDGTSTGKISLAGKACSQAAPLTIRAENQRQARISDGGTAAAIFVSSGTKWIIFDGIVANSTTVCPPGITCNGSQLIATGSPFKAQNVDFITIKNSLFRNGNAYANNALVGFVDSRDCLVEDTEFYNYHRHAITFFVSERMTARRVYGNPRTGKIPNGYGLQESPVGSGDTLVSFYPCKDCLLENGIVDPGISPARAALSEMNATGNAYTHGPMPMSGTKVLGSICLKCRPNGIYANARKAAGAIYSPTDITIENVFIDATGNTANASRYSSVVNARLRHLTLLNGSYNGLVFDDPGTYGASTISVSVRDVIVKGFASRPGVLLAGAYVLTADKIWSSGNGTNFSPALPAQWGAGSATTDPGLGACKLWIPAGAAAKGAGTNGSDIGATILYRYQNGQLTNLPLWNPTTGEFPHGATDLDGTNDNPGDSLFDVHHRLNVNRNGCPFPAGYGSTPPPAFNFSLSNGGNKTVARGASVANTLNASLVSGTAQAVSFSVAGLPSGVTASFSPGSCAPDCAATMTLNASTSAALGTAPLTVTAAGGGIARTSAFTMTVAPAPAATDINGDGITNVTDVQLAVNQASGVSACSTGDINKDGACNVADVQLVINKALGL